ncbi:MAG: hypothetical protein FJ054_07510 [Cyanobacteria bacterium M_surface_10_m2_119]|nr:hypothetical protein [Cyanobacteria bacterium M_surface_10_m2_119]
MATPNLLDSSQESGESDAETPCLLPPIEGTNGADTLLGSGGSQHLSGLNGNDSLWGEAGSDCLEGGNGDDLLDGGMGPDLLIGGHGNDRLIGGGAADRLTGGLGADVFVLGAGDHGEADVITDFQPGVRPAGAPQRCWCRRPGLRRIRDLWRRRHCRRPAGHPCGRGHHPAAPR